MGNDSIIAFRTREQLRKYLGIFSPQFKNSRWKMEFLGQMLFGIQASRDTLMSEIARSLQEDILAKKTQGRSDLSGTLRRTAWTRRSTGASSATPRHA